ncbi:STAS domain-containing protein [Nonomuraea africana]|uniref:Anti-sigma factor antagonist n=1 Tax=Nonomuraea africana TaxID=46171 RepID=A0ABR9KPV8_9ACTN|nr:STAS domain-containing protein [Nonomuraea africana]MBE1564066.1 anti-sigma B factor antagonist [Nonomuraea africana]
MNVLGTGPSAVTTVALSGEIDIFSSAALRERLLGVLRGSSRLLVLDLSAVSFCDTSGLGVLVGIQRRARLMGITLALTGALPYMTQLLHTTGLDRRLPTLI